MPPPKFTPQEQRVADLVMNGRTNKEIAAALSISLNTVRFHLKDIYAKLDIDPPRRTVRRLLARRGNRRD